MILDIGLVDVSNNIVVGYWLLVIGCWLLVVVVVVVFFSSLDRKEENQPNTHPASEFRKRVRLPTTRRLG